jgi:hypothetical protein
VSALANALPSEGPVDVTDTYTGTLEVLAMPDGQAWVSWRQTGVRRANVAGGMFDRMSLRAIGLLWSADGRMHGRGAWELIDAEGSKLFAVSERDGDEIAWRFTGGTGRFEGIEGEGRYLDFAPFPTIVPGTFQQSPRAVGRYRLPTVSAGTV